MSEFPHDPEKHEDPHIPDTGLAAPALRGHSHPMEKEREKPKEHEKTEDSDRGEPLKPATRILEQEIKDGLHTIERTNFSLIVASLAAGLELGFSVFLMAVISSEARGELPDPVVSILVALSYAVGFVLVILGRSELFTEQTAQAVLPVLNGRASIAQLLRTWSLIFLFNIAGGALFALMAVAVGPSLGVIKSEAFGEMAHQVVSHSWSTILLSAVLAGWLMAMLSWLVTAARDTTAQLLVILFVTFTIGLGHLHHVVAGAIEVMVGLFTGQGATLPDFLRFLFWALIGNSIGGIIFVALIKWGYIVSSDKKPEDLEVE